MSGHATQLTPAGIVRVDDGPSGAPDEVIPGGALIAQLAASNAQQSLPHVPAPAPVAKPARKAKAVDPDEPMTAKQMRAMAKKRLRVVRREIKRRAALEREQAQLLRLIKALSDNPEAADVRPIRSA